MQDLRMLAFGSAVKTGAAHASEFLCWYAAEFVATRGAMHCAHVAMMRSLQIASGLLLYWRKWRHPKLRRKLD